MDSWEEGFDTWTPWKPWTPPEAEAGEDTRTDPDRAGLLRLARELAERRQLPQTNAAAEIEQLKRSLRERAEAVAARERALAAQLKAAEKKLAEAEAEHRLAAAEREHLEERDRAAHDREKTLAAARRQLDAERQELEARVAALARTAEQDAPLDRERELDRRELAEAPAHFAEPIAPPSFSEGLAALARFRSRG
jgi:chromosome segregation ATPase